MTSVQGREHSYWERPSVAPSIALSDFSPPPKSGDKLFEQPVGPSETKSSIAIAIVAATNIPKYPNNDLQRIFKAVLEAQALTPTSALAFVISETPWDKLKTRSLDV